MNVIIKILAAAVSAFLMWAAYPPHGETVNIAFALAPMLVIARLSIPRRSAGWWALFGFAFWFATLSWMPAICKNNGPWPLVALGWIGLSAVCAGYFALFGYLDARAWRRLEKMTRGQSVARIVLLLLMEPALWAGIEWLRGTLFSGFAWNFLGTAVGKIPSFATPARLGGVYFVSALVVMLNGVFATLILRAISPMLRREEACDDSRLKRRIFRTLETALPLVAIWLSLEASAMPRADRGKTSYLRVAMIQRNAPCVFTARDQEDPLPPFFDLLDKAAVAKPDLVLLAESAFCEFGPVRSDRTCNTALHFSNRCAGAVVIGGGDDVVYSNGVRRVYNAAACYCASASNALVAVYHKQHLVPFGEYIFLDKWITPLQKLSPIGVSLYPGEGRLFEVEGMRIAPLICFEDTIPDLARNAARAGADIIALITNDSWFSYSAEAEQHASQAVMRALETGLPIVRTGNSGITGIILPSGRTRWLTDGNGRALVDQSGCQVESVPVTRTMPPPLYVKLGDWPLLVVFVLSLLALLPTLKFRRS